VNINKLFSFNRKMQQINLAIFFTIASCVLLQYNSISTDYNMPL